MSASRNAERYEKAFLGLSAGMLVLFLGALFYAAVGMGISLPSRAGELDPNEVRSTPPFDAPGVHRLGPDRYEVVMIGQAWAFQPRELSVPAGAEIVFRLTSVDVLHGFAVERTRLNAMLIPGQVTELTYAFREPGEYLIVCHEYCGIGHHNMYGTIHVVPASEFEPPSGTADGGSATAESDGSGVRTAAPGSGGGEAAEIRP